MSLDHGSIGDCCYHINSRLSQLVIHELVLTSSSPVIESEVSFTDLVFIHVADENVGSLETLKYRCNLIVMILMVTSGERYEPLGALLE